MHDTPGTCDYCDAPATRVAWYGDEDTCFGGGQAPVYLCGDCPAPCTHYADPHAGYTHEESVATAGVLDERGIAVPPGRRATAKQYLR